MSLAYGPEAGIVGTVLEFDIAPDTQDIQVRNDTPNDLFVLFGPAPQPAPGSAVQGANSTDGQWNNVVAAWDHPVLPVGNRGRFDGRVWLLPIDNGGLANSGTRSVRNAIYVIAFEEGDHVPAGSSLPRQHDLTSQARVVSVPITIRQTFRGRTPLSVAVINKFSLGQPTAAQLAAHKAIAYLYWLSLGLGSIGVNAITGWTVNLEFYAGDASNNPIVGFTPIQVYNIDLFASSNNAAPFIAVVDKHVFTPPFPQATEIDWTGLTAPANLCLRINVTGGFGSATLAFNLAADVDFTNTSNNPGDIGNSAAAPFGLAPSDPLLY